MSSWRFALAMLCNLSAAAAQQPADPAFESELQQVEDLVVTASPVDRETLAHSIRMITATHAGVVSRFNDPICPKIVGAKPDAATFIARQVSRVAKSVGARVAPRACTPNFVVMFVPDGKAAIDSIEESRPDIRAAIDPWRWRKMRQGMGPAWAWHTSEIRGLYDGQPVDLYARVWIATRLRPPVRWDTTTAFVIIETGAMKGLTLTQIGSYAAAAGLAPVALDRVENLQTPSIYKLPEDAKIGNSGATDLTSFDHAYLSAIYQSEPGSRLPTITAKALRKIHSNQ
jgi:hypothetical protein